MLREMRIIDVNEALELWINWSNKSQNSSEAFQRSIHIEGLYILSEIRTSLSERT